MILKTFRTILVMLVLSVGFVYVVQAKESIMFDGEKYVLAFSDKSATSDGFINEYLREGEELGSWTKIIGVHHFPKLRDPRETAYGLGQMVRQTNPSANYQIIENEKNGEVIIDFLTWTTQEPRIIEFNIFRYALEENLNGLVAYQFAFRAYGEQNAEKFKQTFVDNRLRWIELLSQGKIPSVVEKTVKKE